MKKAIVFLAITVFLFTGFASADTFGTGSGQFDIDFVTISGETNPTFGYGIVNNDYRMGTYEITNDQWNKFKAAYGTVTGSPSRAYNQSPTWSSFWPGANVPANKISWYEATQFVNYLNTSTGHQEAYKFTGTKGTSNYTFTVWDITDSGYNPNNPYRNSSAFYFLPTEDEWVKAAYWNGAFLQTYASAGNSLPAAGIDTNYYQVYPNQTGPWVVGSGSQELNGTFDMMGNVFELMENPYNDGAYLPTSLRAHRGGSYQDINDVFITKNAWAGDDPDVEYGNTGFRVASIPEPATLLLFGLGGLVLRRRK